MTEPFKLPVGAEKYRRITLTRYSEKLARDLARCKLDGFQCNCGFFTANPEVAAEHFTSRGNGLSYSQKHNQLSFVKAGINLATKETVRTSST